MIARIAMIVSPDHPITALLAVVAILAITVP